MIAKTKQLDDTELRGSPVADMESVCQHPHPHRLGILQCAAMVTPMKFPLNIFIMYVWPW